jgi:SAM-dependent methyltransferase
MRRRALLALTLGAAIAGCGALRQRFPGPDVLFLATPEAIGVEMLRVAGVTADDVVFDLGSGDGRVVIAAAREFGARAVGVEIDPGLVQASRDAALAAGVAGRATFLWQDLFVTDLREATVVTLYLRDDVNLRLRPKLLAELTPGARLVSHDFGMDDWEPDRVQRVRGPQREHRLYLWRIPATVDGVWESRIGGDMPVALALAQRFQRLAGALGDVPTPVAGRLAGERIELAAGALRLRGVVRGAVIDGTAEDGAHPLRAWSARRMP